MEKENKSDIEEIPEAFKILEDNIKKLALQEEKETKDKNSTETDKPILEEKNVTSQQTTFYLNFFINILMTFLNPVLEKYKIKPISMEEITDLSQALMGIISDKMLTTSGKIGSALAKIVNLPKILKLITVIWKIGFPRLNEYLETQKNKTPSTKEI